MDVLLVYCACVLVLVGLVVLIATIRVPHLNPRYRRPALVALAACIVAVAITWVWPVHTSHVASQATQLDRLLPRYQLRERHSIRIHAAPPEIEWGIRVTDGSALRGFGTAMWLQFRIDQVRAVLHGPAVPDFQMAWNTWERNAYQELFVDAPGLLNYYPPEGPQITERWVRAPGGVMLDLPPPYIHNGVAVPSPDEPAVPPPPGDSTAMKARRIFDLLVDDYDHACVVLVARNDTVLTFRLGPRTGQEIWVEVRMEPGGDAYDLRKHFCDGVVPVRDWSVISWLRFYGYDRMGCSPGHEFTLGQLKRVSPVGDHWRRPIARDSGHFVTFDEPGCAKVAMSFQIRRLDHGWCRLDIERRVFAPDTRTAMGYARTWRLSRVARDAFYALWLRRIKGYAEHLNPNSGRRGMSDFALPDTLIPEKNGLSITETAASPS